MRQNRRGTGWISLGLLFLTAALMLTGYNILTQRRAGKASESVLAELTAVMGKGNGEAQTLKGEAAQDGGNEASQSTTEEASQTVTGDTTQSTAGKASQNGESKAQNAAENNKSGSSVSDTAAVSEEEETPLYVDNPQMEMPVREVQGYDYIGVLEIPALGMELPVMSEWDYTRLNIAPCRYSGSAYQDNLVICAHNFDIHFGFIKTLNAGDSVFFTDTDGNTFCYEVVELETLKPYDTDYLAEGDWDLTLFTCTVGGATRLTVRCERIGG